MKADQEYQKQFLCGICDSVLHTTLYLFLGRDVSFTTKFVSALISFLLPFFGMTEFRFEAVSVKHVNGPFSMLDVKTLNEVVAYAFYENGPLALDNRREALHYIYGECLSVVCDLVYTSSGKEIVQQIDEAFIRNVCMNSYLRVVQRIKQPYYLTNFFSALVSLLINRYVRNFDIRTVNLQNCPEKVGQLVFLEDVSCLHQVASWCLDSRDVYSLKGVHPPEPVYSIKQNSQSMSSSSSDVVWQDTSYWLQTLVQGLKEFLGVFMFLVAYSRLELFDTFTGPLVLYMVLVVLAFPFVNSYLFLLMRWGPWYDTKQPVLTSRWWWRTMAQFGLVILAHFLGACAAWGAVKAYRGDGRWESAALVQTVYTGDTKWNDFKAHPADARHTVVAPELSYRAVKFNSSAGEQTRSEVGSMLLFEEFVAVFILLVGILHLVEGVTPKLLQNAFWNVKGTARGDGKVDEYVLTNGAAFSSRHRDMSIMMQRVMFDVHWMKEDLQKMRVAVKGSEASHGDQGKQARPDKDGGDGVDGAAHRSDEQPKLVDTVAYVPVPFMLVFQICILVAGVSRAFPSAHLSMHVSVYNAFMEIDGYQAGLLRIAGGTLAGFAAMGYYFMWYVWVGAPGGDQTKLGPISGSLYRNLLLPDPALLRSEMLRIPSLMAVEVDKHVL
jgi:hypothetical protein